MTNLTRSQSPHCGSALDERVASPDIIDVVRAIVSAAGHVGENGLGKGELIGYFRRFAREQPKRFFALLVRAIHYKLSKHLNGGANKTDILEAVILAATQIGNDGLGKGGLAGYVSKFARGGPSFFIHYWKCLYPIIAFGRRNSGCQRGKK